MHVLCPFDVGRTGWLVLKKVMKVLCSLVTYTKQVSSNTLYSFETWQGQHRCYPFLCDIPPLVPEVLRQGNKSISSRRLHNLKTNSWSYSGTTVASRASM